MIEDWTNMHSFNVFNDQWIAVVDTDGNHEEVSLRTLLDNARHYRGLDGELECQDTAVIRLILAFLYRALEPNDDDWYGIWNAGRFPMDKIEAYVNGRLPDDAWHGPGITSIHDLLWVRDDTAPFLQSPGLKSAGKDDGYRDPSYMIPNIRLYPQAPYGTYNSDRTLESCRRLSIQEAVRWMICLLSYDVIGIHTGMMGDPNVKGGKTHPSITTTASSTVMHIDGGNLFRTLMLALVPLDFDGMVGNVTPPLWEQEPKTAASEDKYTLGKVESVIDEYVFPSRRLLLRFDNDGKVDGVLVGAGDRMICDVEGSKTKLSSYKPGLDPMVGWVKKKSDSKNGPSAIEPWKARKHQALWLGLPSMLRHDNNGGKPLVLKFLDDRKEWNEDYDKTMVNIVTSTLQYDEKKTVIEDIAGDSLILPTTVMKSPRLIDLAIEAVQKVESLAYSWDKYYTELAKASGKTSKASDTKDWMNLYYSTAWTAFNEWVNNLYQDTDSEEAIYNFNRDLHKTIMHLANDVLPEFSSIVYAGSIDNNGVEHSYGKAFNNLRNSLNREDK